MMYPYIRVMLKRINKRTDLGKTIPTVYEDMYPFLDKNEITQASYNNFIKYKS